MDQTKESLWSLFRIALILVFLGPALSAGSLLIALYQFHSGFYFVYFIPTLLGLYLLFVFLDTTRRYKKGQPIPNLKVRPVSTFRKIVEITCVVVLFVLSLFYVYLLLA